MVIYIGADHRGFNHKEAIKKYLADSGYAVADLGDEKYDELDDYPDFAEKVGRKISIEWETNRGILICGSGAGMDIAVNKFPHVRSALVFNSEQAIDVRSDDNANVLSLASDYTSVEDAKKIVSLWLSTEFSGGEKYKRRLQKISDLESKLLKSND